MHDLIDGNEAGYTYRTTPGPVGVTCFMAKCLRYANIL